MEGILKPGYLPVEAAQEDVGPSLHTYFMAYQEGQLSMFWALEPLQSP